MQYLEGVEINMSSETASKNRIYYINLIIYMLLTFGIGFLPPFGAITELGMKCLGVFVGSIYGWLTLGIIFPSLFSMLALALVGFTGVQQAYVDGFSYYLVPMMIVIFIFSGAIATTGVTTWLTEWLMSRKIIIGRPWILVAVLLLGMELLSVLQAQWVGLFMLWEMVVVLSKEAGYEKRNPFLTFMIPALMVVYITASYMFPFFSGQIMYLGFYAQGMQSSIPELLLIIWEIVMINLYVVFILLVAKFILKLDLSKIGAASEIYRDKKCPAMTRDQKFGLALLVGFLVVMLLPIILPDELVFIQQIKTLGIMGMLTIILSILSGIRKKDGTPYADLQKAAHTIPWEVIWLLVSSTPLAAAFNAEECGIMATLMSFLTPILTNMDGILFIIICTIVIGIITQFVHNLIVAIVLLPILCPLFASMGGNPATLYMCLVWALTFAFATPAASMNAALIFGHSSLSSKDGYVNGIMHLVLALILAILVGIPLGNLIF